MKAVHRLRLTLSTIAITASLMSAQYVGAEQIRLVLPSRPLGFFPMFVVLPRGFFKDENLDLELPAMRSNIAHNSLLGGEVEYQSVAYPVLRLAAKDSPLETIFFRARVANYFLMEQSSVKSFSDSRGSTREFNNVIEFDVKAPLKLR